MNLSARSIAKPPFSDSSPRTTLFIPFKRHFQFRFGIEQGERIYPSVISGDSVNVSVRSVAKPQFLLSVSSRHNLIRFLKKCQFHLLFDVEQGGRVYTMAQSGDIVNDSMKNIAKSRSFQRPFLLWPGLSKCRTLPPKIQVTRKVM